MHGFVLLLAMHSLKTVLVPSFLAKFVMHSRDNIYSNSLFLLEAQNLSIWCGKVVSIVKKLNSNGSQFFLLCILPSSSKDDS